MNSLRKFLTGLVVMLLSLPAFGNNEGISQAMDTALSPYFKANTPGATVLVTKDGKTLFRKAYGMANLEQEVAMKPEMIFRLGSITKQFTAVAIMMLSEQKKLDVKDEITKFFPDYPTHGKKITIEHLLTHTSGIMSYTSMPKFQEINDKDLTPQEFMDVFKNEPMQFEPGERFGYCNSGYFILGAMIEKLSNQTYAEFLAQNIFEPLKMKHTAYEGFERDGLKRIEGYSTGANGFEVAKSLSMTIPYAAGALVSTVDDLAKWDWAITEGKLLKPETWSQIFTPFKLNNGEFSKYGYGWSLRDVHGFASIQHGGGINGFRTIAIRIPKEKLYVAILLNSQQPDFDPEYLAEKFVAIALGKSIVEPKEIALASEQLKAYVGKYSLEKEGSVQIVLEGNQLFVTDVGFKRALHASSESEFFFKDSFIKSSFIKDELGTVTTLKVSDQENVYTWGRER